MAGRPSPGLTARSGPNPDEFFPHLPEAREPLGRPAVPPDFSPRRGSHLAGRAGPGASVRALRNAEVVAVKALEALALSKARLLQCEPLP